MIKLLIFLQNTIYFALRNLNMNEQINLNIQCSIRKTLSYINSKFAQIMGKKPNIVHKIQ